MGANAQTSVPTFTAGDVLTAANMNISARTGVPVFASTVTRDAAFGGTGEKTLAEGQMCYVESTGFQTYNGTSWVTWGTAPSTGGLEFISSTTIGTTVSSVAVSNVFSSTYDNYRIIVSGGVGSTGSNILIQFGATTTGYYNGFFRVLYTNSNQTIGQQNQASGVIGAMTTTYINSVCDVLSPNLADETCYQGTFTEVGTGSAAAYFGGFLNNTTSYTGFTILPGSGTLTGGTIKVYGFKN